MPSPNTFGIELRCLRRQSGLTLADVADTLEFSIAYVSQVERGAKNPPNAAAIKKLFAQFGWEQHLDRMLALAVSCRRSVEIPVGGKDEALTNMIVALARRCDEGDLSEELVNEIRKLLDKEGRK